MNLIDTHSHIYGVEFQDDFEKVVERAKQAGVKQVLLPNVDLETVSLIEHSVKKDSAFFSPMMGLHPTSVNEHWGTALNDIYNELNTGEYIAIGEIGMDLYWDQTYKKQQKQVFEEQLRWSLDKQLPVSLHCRNAAEEVMQCIRRVDSEKLKGVFHSFGGSADELKAILELPGFYIGINGVVTFKNSTLPQTLAYASIERIVIETDAPYLAPVPYRGKRNEPSYLKEIVRKLSEIYGISEEEVAETTTRNAKNIFNINSW